MPPQVEHPDMEPKIQVPRRWVPWLVLLLMLAGIGAHAVVGDAFERGKMLLWEFRQSRTEVG